MRVAQFLFAIILAAASGCVVAPPAPLAQTGWVEYSTGDAPATFAAAGVAWRKWTPDALVLAGEMAGTLSYILPTHAHFDHMAGAEDLPGVPVLPGSVGVFTTVGQRRVFLVGDAALISEAVERGLPKVDPLRAAVENDVVASDSTVATLAAFHAAHPEVLVIPAHDRTAWQAAFGESPRCIAGAAR